MKKTLLVDLDYVMCIPGFLTIVNRFFKTNYKEEDFENYIIDDIFGNRASDFYNYYLLQDGYKDATIINGAKEALFRLSKYYDIHICSACVMYGLEKKSAKLFKDKFNYIIKEFPFINPENIIFTNSKNIFHADAQIDDRIQNLEGDVKLKLLFDAYHNKKIDNKILEEKNVIRVYNWSEVEKLLMNNI